MQFHAAKFIRRIISLAAFSLPLSLLILSACGGSGGGGGGGASPPGKFSPVSSGGLMVSTFAGTANPGADGVGAAARFNGPGGVVSDGANLYVVDALNNTIRKVVIATGAVSTLAGKVGVAGAVDGFGTAATFSSPTGIAIDSTHTYLYVADTGNNKIRRVMISSGAVTSFTGTPYAAVTAGAIDGAASGASFKQPRGIAMDSTDTYLYVADTGNNKIRQIAIASGTVSSLTGAAGVTVTAGAADGAAFSASFNSPDGIVIAGSSLYVADANNNKIRQVSTSSGATSSLTGASSVAGTAGAADGQAASAAFAAPSGITTDNTNLYVADANNNKIRQIVIATGAVSSFTGASGMAGTAGFADGSTPAATFNLPSGITAVGGNLYVTDSQNNTVRKIAGGTVTTLAGNANPGADGVGAAARFNAPRNIVSDGVNLYVADANNFTIRKIVIATGAVTTLAGTGASGVADGTGLAASFNSPAGITTDGTSLYVTDALNNKIRKITPASGSLSAMTSANAVVTSLTGLANTSSTAGAADGAAASAAFSSPYDITTDGANLYVADAGNNKIRQVVIATGAVSSLTGASNVAVTAGAADGAATAATFFYPAGISIDSTKSNLYVADTKNNKIRQVMIATGAVSSLTGASNVAVTAGAADGAIASATFNLPGGIATDGVNLYVADFSNNKIRQIAIASGVVSSYTGVGNTAGATGHADGAPSAATFSGPGGIAVVGSALYVTDSGNNTIRKIQ